VWDQTATGDTPVIAQRIACSVSFLHVYSLDNGFESHRLVRECSEKEGERGTLVALAAGIQEYF